MSLCEKHDEISYCHECGKTCQGCLLDEYSEHIVELQNALLACKELIEEALPKFNWTASTDLDAETIQLIKNTTTKVNTALKQ